MSGEEISKNVYYVYIVAISATLLRGVITLFKLYTPTQYLMEMTVSVLRGLIPFIIVLAGQNMIFATIFIATDFVDEKFVDS